MNTLHKYLVCFRVGSFKGNLLFNEVSSQVCVDRLRLVHPDVFIAKIFCLEEVGDWQ